MENFLQPGTRFGRLTVIGFSHKVHKPHKNSKDNYYEKFYTCKCDCGNVGVFSGRSLKSGNTKSCGCLITDILSKRNTTHGLSKTKLYKTFHGMKKRCYNKHDKRYKNYGGRGITICDEWLFDFLAFYKWAKENGYRDDLSIERKNVNLGYCPENCTWIPVSEQTKNTTRNVFYEFNGKKLTLQDWARLYKIPFTCLRHRIERGWNMEKALLTPKK